MNIYQLIESLITYGINKKLISSLDYYYYVNEYLALFKLDEYVKQNELIDLKLDIILDGMLSYAIENNIIENTTENKDLFDTKIMGVITPKTSEIVNAFNSFENIKDSTEYFYNLCKDINYIRTSRIKKDIHYDYESEYCTINISINMSKPEKDPNDIKKLLTIKKASYPKCMLCRENENYQGRIGFPARQNLRSLPILLDGCEYYIQYSPYSYYNEHLICYHNDHFNMIINDKTIKELVDFVDKIPHYFIGSNADLPIVGGSILNHQHFQGGSAILPMENATKHYVLNYNNVDIYRLHWPLSVIRLISENKNDLINVACKYLALWKDYLNEDLMIINKDENGQHNTVTPIVRKKDGKYEVDLALRNNITTESRPLGYFHPQEKYWHIKKENIGLIEVMGLAILPSRLKKEMSLMEKYLLNKNMTVEELDKIKSHMDFINNLKDKNNINEKNVENIIKNGVGEVFVNVLKDCGVFKDDSQDKFIDFINSIKEI